MKTTVLDDGTELESPLVVVGVGSKPRTELFKGQVDLLEDRPGGVKVSRHRILAAVIPHNIFVTWGSLIIFPLDDQTKHAQ